MPTATAAISIRDVARAANVSASTVWLVLNNRPNVSNDVRGRVRRILEQLNYRPRRRGRTALPRTTLRAWVIYGRRSMRGDGGISELTRDPAPGRRSSGRP
jgi:hypothetical protein